MLLVAHCCEIRCYLELDSEMSAPPGSLDPRDASRAGIPRRELKARRSYVVGCCCAETLLVRVGCDVYGLERRSECRRFLRLV